jgi:hypothetical protein
MATHTLNQQKKNKNDEYYTQYKDVALELDHYKEHFIGKVILLPCDTINSNFTKYFIDNFETFGLKKLVATSYIKGGSGTLFIKSSTEESYTTLTGDGDFNSAEVIALRDESDLVITNPPFSIFTQFIEFASQKQFIVMGAATKLTTKVVFSKIFNNVLFTGYNHDKATIFITPDGTKQVNITWFTNIKINKSRKLLNTKKLKEFIKYDNLDAIEVKRIAEYPHDYTGLMGVSINILNFWDPEKFEFCGAKQGSLKINGKHVFTRFLIKNVVTRIDT